MSAFTAQLWRELWEHPVLYVAPAVIGALVLVSTAAMLLMGGGSGDVVEVLIRGLDVSNPGLSGPGLTLALISFLPAFVLPLIVIASFYLLDCLGAERRDRSILFFKSLPVSDLTTVLSKLATALLLAPALTLAALIVTQLGVLLSASIAVALGDGVVAALWSPSRLASVWVFAVYSVLAFNLWYAPTFCFLLAVSAWARRATLVWASSPLLLVLLERVLTGQSRLGQLLARHMNGFWSTAYLRRFQIAIGEDEALSGSTGLEAGTRIWDWMDPVGLVTSPTLWIGLFVAAGFVAAAVYLRRYRDDS